MTPDLAPSLYRRFTTLLVSAAALLLGGCVSQNSKDKPQVEVHGEAGVTWASGRGPRPGLDHQTL